MDNYIKSKKALILPVILIVFMIAPTVYAASSTFLLKATQWYQSNCKNGNVPKGIAIDCYLFDKVSETDAALGTLTTRVSSTEDRLTTLEHATPSPTSIPETKGIKIVDANGTELGIYVDTFIFFYPPLNRFVSFQGNGGYATGGAIYFALQNCTGDAYKSLNDGDMFDHGKFVFNAGDSRFFVVDPTTPNTSVITQSHLDTGICTNSLNTFSQRLLREVSLPLPNPIPFPIQYKYQ